MKHHVLIPMLCGLILTLGMPGKTFLARGISEAEISGFNGSVKMETFHLSLNHELSPVDRSLFPPYQMTGSNDNLDLAVVPNIPEIEVNINKKQRPSMPAGKVVGQMFLGMVGCVGLGIAGASINTGDSIFGANVLLGLFGTTFGTAIGVSLAGCSKNMTSSFGAALLGSVLGHGLYFVLNQAVHFEKTSGFLAMTLFAACAASISCVAFNMTCRYKMVPEPGLALLNVKDGRMRLGIPAIGVQPEFHVTKSIGIHVRLMNIRL